MRHVGDMRHLRHLCSLWHLWSLVIHRSLRHHRCSFRNMIDSDSFFTSFGIPDALWNQLCIRRGTLKHLNHTGGIKGFCNFFHALTD